MRTLTIRTLGEPSLAATLHGSPSQAQRAILIAPAMGTPMRYYTEFADWLAAQGNLVMCFDYRGMGESRGGQPLRGLQADLHDWAQDTDAALVTLAQQLPHRPLYLIGHSLGAQLPGLLIQRHRLSGLICIAAGSGHWRYNPYPLRMFMPIFWHVLMPLVTWLCGHFPGRRLRLVGDLPSGVAWHWRRWCLHPDYHLGEELQGLQKAFSRLSIPVTAFAIADDTMMSKEGTQALLNWFSGSLRRRLEVIHPSQGERIGHIGFFRQRFRQTHWRHVSRALADFESA